MAVQIIVNGGFETGALRPWRKTPGTPPLGGGIVDAVSRSGSYSLELQAMNYVEQSFAGVIAHATGPLTFWTKAASALMVGPFFVNVSYHDGTVAPGVLVSPDDRWKKITVPVEKSKRLQRIQFAVGESGSIYIDDVSLVGSRKLVLPTVASTSRTPVKRAAKKASRKVGTPKA